MATTAARCLCDSTVGTVDEVVDLEPGPLANAKAAGVVDDNETAAAYAESLAGE